MLIGSKDNDDIGPLGGLGVRHDLKTSFFSLGFRTGAILECHDNFDTRVTKVLRVGVPL